METDAELLQRFAANADEKAFRRLVERHAGMVYGVALRSVGDPAMAEEISQGVFTLFARKARSLVQKRLSGWLHDAAVLEARNFSRKAARYRKVVSAYQNEMSASTIDTVWEEVSPHLDEALSRLPERSKSMVIMRFYERLSFREIAAAFGKSEEASRKEVERSVQQLGTMLKKRGITTTGAALAAVLGSQTLCVPPASASALATASLEAISLSTIPLLERAGDWLNTTLGERKMIIVALFAFTPAAFLLAKNIQLETEIRELRQAGPQPAAGALVELQNPVRRTGPLAAADASPVAAPALHTPAKALEQAKEQAELELTRISLNLPSLRDAQKAGIQTVFERRNAEKLTAKMAAFESGAVRRFALNPDDLSDEDKSLLFAMEPGRISPSEDHEIQSLLSAAQFEEYVRTEETKRISNAEAAAADVLKAIGRSIDLNPEQKDTIFQQLARLELNGPEMDEAQRSRPFGERDATEEARDQIVLDQLTAEQAEVYSKFREEQKAGFTEFLKSFGPREETK